MALATNKGTEVGGMLSGSDADIRHREILDTLYERHPGSKEILMELDNLFGKLWCEAADEGARRQGLLIRAALDGQITVTEDGVQGTVEI